MFNLKALLSYKQMLNVLRLDLCTSVVIFQVKVSLKGHSLIFSR